MHLAYFVERSLDSAAVKGANPGFRITLKGLANFSPGFALKPWVQKRRKRFFATLKELRLLYGLRTATQLFQSCVFEIMDIRDPRVAKAQPWAEISERFQR